MSDHKQADTLKPIDRDNIIFYKRRPEFKSNFKSMTDDEDIQSATSLKASSNQPLPELQKQKRKLVIKPFVSLQTKHGQPLVEKEVRQHENILLKQRNNLLSSENLKLKTKITVLEKQNQRLQKSIDNQNSSQKPNTSYSNNRDKIKAADNTLRAIIRGLRKQIEDLKKQNLNIKSAVKFTSLKELQTERDQLAEQTIRLRLTLQQQQARKTTMKNNAQGLSNLQHKIQILTDKNSALLKQLIQATQKCKKIEQTSARAQRAIENDKKNSKALQTALLQIREKDRQIEQLKGQLKTSHSIPSSALLQQTPKQNKFQLKRPSVQRNNPKPVISTKNSSLQKNPNNPLECKKCSKYQSENKSLLQKIKKLESDLEKAKGSYGQLPKGPIAQVKPQQIQQLKRFLMLRFKAHRLSYQESEKYLINCQGAMNQTQLNKLMSVRELMESLLVQPFCIVSNRYLEVIIWRLAFGASKEPVSIDDNKQVKKQTILDAYRDFMSKYEILSQQKQEEMFIQVAELITTYYQQILAALTAKRNGEGTIAQKAFLQFFKEIELQQEYIDFIITQIILESLDMDHLNFFAMFEIFYMPQMTANQSANNSNKKKKFQVDNAQIVQQEDQEYEQSKSHLGSRNKTLQQREKDEEGEMKYQWSEQNEQKVEKKNKNQHPFQPKQKLQQQVNENLEEQYGQQFQQQGEKGGK